VHRRKRRRRLGHGLVWNSPAAVIQSDAAAVFAVVKADYRGPYWDHYQTSQQVALGDPFAPKDWWTHSYAYAGLVRSLAPAGAHGPDGLALLVVAGTAGCEEWLLHPDTGERLSHRTVHTDDVHATAVVHRPDGRTLVAASCSDGRVRIWEAGRHAPPRTLSLGVTVTAMAAIDASLCMATESGLVTLDLGTLAPAEDQPS
jgi:WD40 repeat protein